MYFLFSYCLRKPLNKPTVNIAWKNPIGIYRLVRMFDNSIASDAAIIIMVLYFFFRKTHRIFNKSP